MSEKYKIGLALSGGGAKGFAHCGALLALEEFGLKPDVICGTSAGAIAGSMYCAGADPFAIAESFLGKEFSSFARIRIPQAGLFDNTPMLEFLRESLQGKSFDDLEIPMYVATSDLDRGESVVFANGDLAKVVLASSSVPVVFNPVNIDGVNYVDGGIFRNFPVSPIREMCDIVVGVNVNPKIVEGYSLNMLNIAMRSFYFMSQANTLVDIPLCDILIELEELEGYAVFDLKNINTIFRVGYNVTVAQLEEQYNLTRQQPSRRRDLGSKELVRR